MAGYYDKNKDYAAAIKKETDPGKKQQLISERQNKIDAMNAAGTNTKGYTNSIYSGGSSSSGSSSNKNSGSSSGSSGSSGSSSGGNKGTGGYYDANKDYAAAIKNETDPVKKAQLIQERQNKIDAMNAAGTNTQGWSNDVYTGGNKNPSSFTAEKPKGVYQSQDAVINNTALGREQLTAVETSALQTAGNPLQEPVPTSAVTQDYTQQTALGTDPAQQLAAQAYFARQQSNIDPSEVQGVYAGDESLSLPDQLKIKAFQKAYNEAKAAGNQAGMDAAHKGAELVREDYRTYPLANSDGYGLGENNIGYIRDIVVRTDNLGNKYVDQYNGRTMTTTMYDANGNFVNRLQGTDIGRHDARVAKEMQRTNDALARHGKENNTFAVRISDPNDANLSVAELREKYGNPSGGMGTELYSGVTVSKKIPNGQSLASMNGVVPAGSTYNGGTVAAVNTGATAYGYFDPDMDYAAAIAAEKDPVRRAELMQQRQNKIDYLNATGQNQQGYTNAIYGQSQQQTMLPTAQQGMMPEYIGMAQDDLQAEYDRIADLQAAAREEQLALTQAQLQAAQTTANSEYDELARQAYINMRTSQNALPQQLAALGISGGGSETANLRLQTNYQNNLNSSEQQRAQMLKDFALQGLAAQTQANSDISGIKADAAMNGLNAWQNEQANQNSWNQWLANYQLQLQQRQDSLSQYDYEKAQNELVQAVELAQLTGDYTKLAALGYDTSYLEQLKKAELESLALDAALQRANIAKLNGSVTSRVVDEGGDDDPTYYPIANQQGSTWINVPGYGRVADKELKQMLENGTVVSKVINGKEYYMKA